MNETVMMSIPLKSGVIDKYKCLLKEAAESTKWAGCWERMLHRYDGKRLDIYYSKADNTDYAHLVFQIGPQFLDRIKMWNEPCDDPFETWFKEQINSMYAVDPLSTANEQLISICSNVMASKS